MSELLRPQDLNKIRDDADTAKMREQLEGQRRMQEQENSLREAFTTRELHPDVMDRINAAVRRAAEQGLSEIQVLTFPAKLCNDGGRRINNFEHNWPDSLEGFAKKAHEFFEKELAPLGYKLRAQVMSYPGGMPGDVSMFLKW